MRNKIRGFTLIELIVATTIIMVVTAVGISSFTGSNKKARDNRRVADMEKIRQALEIYRQEVGHYPALKSQMSTYIEWPTDPKGNNYVYSVGSSFTYSLHGAMEVDGGNTTGQDCSSDGSGNAPCNFVMRNP